MPTETEVKVLVSDLEELRRRLGNLPAQLLSARHFEDNFVLDFPDGRIGSGRCLLRVRSTDHGAWLTFKGTPRPEGIFKVREELESGISSAPQVLDILHRLGLKEWFRYQKYRSEFRIAPPGGESLKVALDETPIGNFAEFEGHEEAIRRWAAALGFSESEFLRDSYYTLYMAYCRERGIEPAHLVFHPAP